MNLVLYMNDWFVWDLLFVVKEKVAMDSKLARIWRHHHVVVQCHRMEMAWLLCGKWRGQG